MRPKVVAATTANQKSAFSWLHGGALEEAVWEVVDVFWSLWSVKLTPSDARGSKEDQFDTRMPPYAATAPATMVWDTYSVEGLVKLTPLGIEKPKRSWDAAPSSMESRKAQIEEKSKNP